jgi:signal peptidase I
VAAPLDLAESVLRRSRRRGRARRAAVVGAGLAMAVAVAAAALPGRSAYFSVIQPSAVMEPTVGVGERVVFSRTLAPARGDVVQAHIAAAAGDGYDTVQRVMAVGGDTVACPAGPDGRCHALVVNDATVAEPYMGGATTDPFPMVRVPGGFVFLMGDNRPAANDSRRIGPVPLPDVSGVAVQVVDDDGHARRIPGAPPHAGPGKADVTDSPDTVPPAKSADSG